MDNLPEIQPVFWMITTGITTLSSIILGVITWVKSAKLMPKELTKAELENRQAEVSLIDQYEMLATKAAEKAVNVQERLSKNEEDIETMKKTIKSQDETIRLQSLRLDQQDVKIREQTGEINGLVKKLNLSQAYNAALIKQMKNENLTPIEISDINPEDYKDEIKAQRIYERKESNKK